MIDGTQPMTSIPVGSLLVHRLYEGSTRYGIVYKVDTDSPSPIAWVFWQLNKLVHPVSSQSYTEPVLVWNVLEVINDKTIAKELKSYDVIALPVDIDKTGGTNEC